MNNQKKLVFKFSCQKKKNENIFILNFLAFLKQNSLFLKCNYSMQEKKISKTQRKKQHYFKNVTCYLMQFMHWEKKIEQNSVLNHCDYFLSCDRSKINKKKLLLPKPSLWKLMHYSQLHVTESVKEQVISLFDVCNNFNLSV